MLPHSSLPRSTIRSWFRALSALPLVLATGTPAHAIPLDPNAYASLGSIAGETGTLTLNTSTLLASGLLRNTGGPALVVGSLGVLQSQGGGPDIAVFTFDDIDLGAGVNLNITGTRPVAILSKGNAVFRSGIDVSASGAIGRAGGGNGGPHVTSSNDPLENHQGAGPGGGLPGLAGGGGGFGGPGGNGAKFDPSWGPGSGGAAYGGAADILQGGSGGGGGAGFVDDGDGGAGGGAVQIVTLGTTDVVRVAAKGAGAPDGGSADSGGGGSGGMIVLRGDRVRVGAGASLLASGGSTVDPGQGFPGGGGGGGRILVTSREFAWGVDAAGTFDVSGGTAQQPIRPGVVSPETGKPGVVTLRTGTVSIGPGQVIALANDPVTLPGTSQTLEFDDFRIDTGGLAFASTAFTITKDLAMNGGIVAAPAGLAIAGGRTLSGFGTVSGPVHAEAGSFLVAAHGSLSLGDLSAPQGANIEGAIAVEQGSTLQLQSAGQVTLGTRTRLFSNSRLMSANGIEVAAGTTLESFGRATIDGSVRNQGTIEGPTGNDQALVFLDDVDGAGDFTGNVVFRGGFSPGNSPAVVSMDNIALDPTAVLSIEIAGREPGQFDQLVVSGSATLGGTLHLSFIDGFSAQAGDSFAFIVGGTVTGTFANVNVTGVDPALGYAIAYGANGVRFDVQAVPEPQTWALLGLGLAVVGIAGGRRAATGSGLPG